MPFDIYDGIDRLYLLLAPDSEFLWRVAVPVAELDMCMFSIIGQVGTCNVCVLSMAHESGN